MKVTTVEKVIVKEIKEGDIAIKLEITDRPDKQIGVCIQNSFLRNQFQFNHSNLTLNRLKMWKKVARALLTAIQDIEKNYKLRLPYEKEEDNKPF